MPRSRISARRWARSLGPESPVNAAMAGLFHTIESGSYDCSDISHACPLVDMSLGGKAFSKPRLSFLITPVVDGGGAVGDEFAHVNSCCRSEPQYDRPEEGESMYSQSSDRLLDPQHDEKLGFQPGAIPEERRILVQAMPPHAPVTNLPKSTASQRRKRSGVPYHFCKNTNYHLRMRQKRTEDYIRRAATQKAHVSSATAEIPEVQNDRLTPEQLAELQEVIETYREQISWDPNDIGCLSPE